jgi:hypothetical protein
MSVQFKGLCFVYDFIFEYKDSLRTVDCTGSCKSNYCYNKKVAYKLTVTTQNVSLTTSVTNTINKDNNFNPTSFYNLNMSVQFKGLCFVYDFIFEYKDSLRTVYIRKVTRSCISKDNRERFTKKIKPYRYERRDSST